MAFPQGIYFRSTDNQSDPTDYDAEVGSNNYPRTSAQGNTVGWESSVNVANRNVTTDVRLKGIAFAGNSSNSDYRIDLPATGNYSVRLAAGDGDTFTHPERVRFLDTTTVLADREGGDVVGIGFLDAGGTVRGSEAAWVSNNTLSDLGAFASTIFRMRMGNSTGTSDPNTVIAALYIEATAAATGSGRLVGGNLVAGSLVGSLA